MEDEGSEAAPLNEPYSPLAPDEQILMSGLEEIPVFRCANEEEIFWATWRLQRDPRTREESEQPETER